MTNKLAREIERKLDDEFFNRMGMTGAQTKQTRKRTAEIIAEIAGPNVSTSAPVEQATATTTSTPAELAGAPGLALVSGADLYDREYPPRQPILDGLLFRGNCVVLASKPKSGKSWWVFQLAQAVDTGKPFLGRPTSKCTILYLALEDGDRRIHERQHARKWRPAGVTFAFGCLPFAKATGRGVDMGPGLDQIKAAAEPFDLIIIDTLIAALGGQADESDNAQMGAIMNALAQFAHESGKTIIIVHHATKGETEDAFDAIRGAGAIRGAYDLGLVLQRKNKEREAVLRVESRDVEAQDMTIIFDGATGWSYEGDATAYDNIKAGRRVVKAIREIGDEHSTEEIAKHLGVTEQAARAQLTTAEERKLVTRSQTQGTNKNGKPTKSIDMWSLAL